MHIFAYWEIEESGRPRLPHKEEFAGSNPAFPTKKRMKESERYMMLISSLNKEKKSKKICQSKITFAKRFIKDVLGLNFENCYIEYVRAEKSFAVRLMGNEGTSFFIGAFYEPKAFIKQHYIVTCFYYDDFVFGRIYQRNRLKKALIKFNN